MSPAIRPFGHTRDGRAVDVIRISAGDLTAQVITFGAALQDLRLAGTPRPLTLGSDSLAAYEGPLRNAGAICGPVVNRIAGAQAVIGGKRLRFDPNEGPNLLHSGDTGMDRQVWTVADTTADSVTLRIDLPDGLGGFPGNRRVTARYSIRKPAVLRLDITAETDRPTLMNPAPHSYWNLDGRATTEGQRLAVLADRRTVLDAALLPTGEVAPVAGTDFDLRGGTELTDRPRFDTNFCLAEAAQPLSRAATLHGRSGVTLDLWTTAPGLQVYDAQRLDSQPWPELTGQPYGNFAGVALEPQLWPDAPHHPGFPSIVLQPGETFRQETEIRLSRRDPGH